MSDPSQPTPAADAAAAPAQPSASTPADNPLYGKAPSAAKLKKLAEKEAKKAAKKAAQAQSAADGSAAVSAAASSSAAAVAAASSDYRPKVPKGTRDSTPEQMAIREKAFAIITGAFKRHGAVGIDTPVFELKETLTNKYGEDSKLIYDLADQGGELCSLRYDLTVPFARYLATHAIDNIKRYHIARVYRRDNPAMTKGRFREFYQCDYDIAGVYSLMVADSEVLKVLCEILDTLPGIGPYKVKLNHRKLLDGVMQLCGVPAEKLRPICSAIDKLDKESWETVKKEMTVVKGLDESVADKLGEYVKIAGAPLEVVERLRKESGVSENALVSEALNELDVLFQYLTALGCIDRISFDLSLARGLDYYTGVIYEAAQTGPTKVGSIAAGGRYDNLVGMFSHKQVPAVGVSIGIERILNILEQAELAKGKPIKKSGTQVLVGSIGDGLLLRRMQLSQQLWQLGVAAEYMYDVNPKPKKQLDYVLANQIPYVIWIGEEELKTNQVKVKDMQLKTEQLVPIDQAPIIVRQLIKTAERKADDAIVEAMEQAQIKPE